jgi:hypothetical protein
MGGGRERRPGDEAIAALAVQMPETRSQKINGHILYNVASTNGGSAFCGDAYRRYFKYDHLCNVHVHVNVPLLILFPKPNLRPAGSKGQK